QQPTTQQPTPQQPTPQQPEPPPNHAPVITSVSSYTEGVLVYLSVKYRDEDGDAIGFGHEWLIVANHQPATYTFAHPSYGRVSPGRVDYPFNHACGEPNQYESDVKMWIYDEAGNQSVPIVAHLACN
ncbi:MAG: hypothetical protein L0H84_03090, partial [Pseudonocardia sp.]|nr:hypothetical protein [Pseudonocardia sp.]